MGSFDSFHESCLCGANPNALHTRETVDCDMPRCSAIDRVDQCVAFFGVVSRVAVIRSLICSSPTVRGRPGRGSSSNPSQRCSTNRPRHRRTVPRLRPRRCATSVFDPPSAAARTIRERIAKPEAVVRRRAHPSSSRRSSSVRTISTARGPRVAIPQSINRMTINDSGH